MKQKLVILYTLKELPIEIKTIIIDKIDIYLDTEINNLEDYEEEEEYWHRDLDLFFKHLQFRNYLDTYLDYDSYPDTD